MANIQRLNKEARRPLTTMQVTYSIGIILIALGTTTVVCTLWVFLLPGLNTMTLLAEVVAPCVAAPIIGGILVYIGKRADRTYTPLRKRLIRQILRTDLAKCVIKGQDQSTLTYEQVIHGGKERIHLWGKELFPEGHFFYKQNLIMHLMKKLPEDGSLPPLEEGETTKTPNQRNAVDLFKKGVGKVIKGLYVDLEDSSSESSSS